jgi:hypothetical protein
MAYDLARDVVRHCEFDLDELLQRFIDCVETK